VQCRRGSPSLPSNLDELASGILHAPLVNQVCVRVQEKNACSRKKSSLWIDKLISVEYDCKHVKYCQNHDYSVPISSIIEE